MNADIATYRYQHLDISATDEQVNEVLACLRRVFAVHEAESETGSSPHLCFERWRERLANPYASIFYATKPDQIDPMGVFFSYSTVQPEVGAESLHIWMAGITEEARGTGIFTALMQRTRQHATDLGVKHMTICTIPDRFPKMYAILKATGWTSVGWKDAGDSKRARVLLRMDL